MILVALSLTLCDFRSLRFRFAIWPIIWPITRLHKQFAQTHSGCFLIILKEKGGQLFRFFAQTVFLFGWVFLGGVAPS